MNAARERRLIFQLCLVAVALSSCSKPEEAAETESGRPACEVFLVDPEAARTGLASEALTRFSQLSVARDFVVACQFNRLVPGQTYSIDLGLRDPTGSPVKLAESQVSLTASDQENIVFFAFDIEPTQKKPGKWTVDAAIKGMGANRGEFVLLAPNASEQVALTRHEKALENVFNAFAHYWLGITENPATFMTELATDQSRPRRPSVNASFGASFSGKAEEPEARTSRAISSSFFQISGVEYHFVEDHVSDADKLNGISYRGRAAFSFTAHRSYDPENGWSPWRDIDRAHSGLSAAASEIADTLFAMSSFLETKRLIFNGAPLAPALRFEVFCQDNAWFVISDRTHLFVNGVPRGNRDPLILEIHPPTLIAYHNLSQPSLEDARSVVEEGSSPRKVASQLSDSVKLTSDATEYQVSRTMTILRGRSLN